MPGGRDLIRGGLPSKEVGIINGQPAQNQPSPTVIVALIVASIIYGAWAIIAKEALSHGIAPIVFVTYRCAGGCITLLIVTLVWPAERSTWWYLRNMDTNEVKRFVLFGMVLAGNVCGFLFAIKRLPALVCCVFQLMIPVVAAIISALLGIENFTSTKAASILCSVMGAIIVVLATGGFDSSVLYYMDLVELYSAISLGPFFLVLNVLCAASFWVMQKDFLAIHPPIICIMLPYGVAAVIAGLIGLTQIGFDADAWLLEGSQVAWEALAYAVLLATALNYSIMTWANKVTSPATITSFMTLQPLSAAALSQIFLGITLTSWQLVGAAFITTGLYLNTTSLETDVDSQCTGGKGEKFETCYLFDKPQT